MPSFLERVRAARFRIRIAIALVAIAGIALFALARLTAEPQIRSPLDFRIRISGSFGEYRPASRYHHGVDIKTYEQNGFPVYAPLDGIVSAIHTSEYGYGNGLFLRSGKFEFTFGHLQDFKGVREDLELYRLSLRFLQPDHYAIVRPPAWFAFSRGEAMARTGESGLGAPHLHFEVREDGVYRNPLLFTGTAIEDRTKPAFTHLAVETRDARYLIALPEEGGTAPVVLPSVPMRLLVGAFDTQSALNRNGVASFSFGSFSRTIDRILPEQLASADEIIHPTLTFIGRTYFYYLYEPGPAAYRLIADGETIVLRDAAGNSSELRLQVKSGADIERFKIDSAGLARRAVSGNASLTAALPGPGTVSVQAVSAPELKPGLVQAGPAFRITLRDVKLQLPMHINYTGGAPGSALYHVHPVTGLIGLIGAGRPYGNQTVFDAPVRLEGIVLPLLDRIPPRVERSFLFGHPATGEVEADPEESGWFREYYLADIGSSIAPEATVVLLNGNPYPFAWQRDRSAVSVSIPQTAAKEGAILSIRCRDNAGNESDWFLDSVEQ